MSCGSAFGRRGKGEIVSAMRPSGEIAKTSIAGSAAWAQQPQVTQVGGHAPSLRPASSKPVHGSDRIRLEIPDALSMSNPTMRANANRRTQRLYYGLPCEEVPCARSAE
jgi:hypothetical protein